MRSPDGCLRPGSTIPAFIDISIWLGKELTIKVGWQGGQSLPAIAEFEILGFFAFLTGDPEARDDTIPT